MEKLWKDCSKKEKELVNRIEKAFDKVQEKYLNDELSNAEYKKHCTTLSIALEYCNRLYEVKE